MAKLIKLTLEHGGDVYVNANYILYTLREKNKNYTLMKIVVGGGKESTFFILETPEQIQELVNN